MTTSTPVEHIPVERLRLDRRNLRWPAMATHGDQSEAQLSARLYGSGTMTSLARSISALGFNPDPRSALSAVRAPDGSGDFVVVDGNLRLLATRMLDPALTPIPLRWRADRSESWRILREQAKSHDLTTLPVIVDPGTRDSVEHAPWFRASRSSMVAAREASPVAVAALLTASLKQGGSPREVSSRYGMHHYSLPAFFALDIVWTCIVGDRLIERYPDEQELLNALEFGGVRSFIGLAESGGDDPEPYDSPPDADRLRDFVEVLRHAAGTPVVELMRILTHDDARETMLRTRNAEKAQRVLAGPETTAYTSLMRAGWELRTAADAVAEVADADDALIHRARSVRERAVEIEGALLSPGDRATCAAVLAAGDLDNGDTAPA